MVPEYFDSSIVKINKDGDQVLSTTLDEGEKLVTGETYEEVRDGALLTKSHDVALTPIQDPDGPLTTMTLDETKTSTFSGTRDGYSNSGDETSHDKRDDITDSGVESAHDETNPVEGDDSDKSDDSTENDTVLTLDETKTNTVVAKESDVDDERQPAPTNSGAPATQDAPSEDGEANSGEQPTENTSVSTDGDDSDSLQQPKRSESKEKWFKYAAAKHAQDGTEFPYADDYEGTTKETLVTEYGE